MHPVSGSRLPYHRPLYDLPIPSPRVGAEAPYRDRLLVRVLPHVRVLPRASAASRRPHGVCRLRGDTAACSLQLRPRVSRRNHLLAKRPRNMAAGFARPVHLRGVLQCAVTFAIRSLPSLLFQAQMVAGAHHRFFGDALVRDDPAHRIVGHLRAPISSVRCGRPDPKHLRRHAGILAGGSCDARATRLTHGEPARGRGGAFRQCHEARPLLRARFRADSRTCGGIDLPGVSIRPGCSPD